MGVISDVFGKPFYSSNGNGDTVLKRRLFPVDSRTGKPVTGKQPPPKNPPK